MTVGARDHPGINLGHAHGDHHEAAEVPVFGFWVFMMSDLIIFGLLFATYVSMHSATAGGPGPRDLFELRSAGIETAVLLASSFTFGMASLALKYDKRRYALLAWLGMTLVLGIIFLGLELHDFYSMAEKGGVPTRSGYLSAFFALVPLHGFHVLAGSIWMVALMGQMFVHGVDRQVKTGILRLAILWHFLDIIWVGIFSVVYLGGLA